MSRAPKPGLSTRPRSLTPTPGAGKDSLSIPLSLYAQSAHSALSLAEHAPPEPKTRIIHAWSRSRSVVHNSRGLLLMLLSQFFGSTMSLCTRVLETSFPEQKMHAIQILLIRQGVTTVIVAILLGYRKVEHAPWGPRGIRWLLVARGLAGFLGVFGLYYSLAYLDLSDATVITFLAPIITTFACSLIPYLKESFTKTELFASVFSLFGVVLIAQPASLFSRSPTPDDSATVHPQRSLLHTNDVSTTTPHQRLIAVLVSLLGVLGVAMAFTMIRWIGPRGHALIVMLYFSLWCTIVSLASLIFIPSIGGLIWPNSLLRWVLLLCIGISGFAMQFFLTLGLQIEKTSRATNMVYTQMLFALVWERIVWGTIPGVGSLMGSACILGSVIWVGVKKAGAQAGRKERDGDEEVGLMGEDEEERVETENSENAWGLEEGKSEDGMEGDEEEEDESEDRM